MDFSDLIPVETISARPQQAPRKFFLEKLEGKSSDYVLSIDNSFLEAWSNCPTLAKYHLVDGKTAGENEALNYGGAIHLALKQTYEELQAGTFDEMTFFRSAERIESHLLAYPPPAASWRTIEHAQESLRRYYKAYLPSDSNFKILHVEKPFRIPLEKITVNRASKTPLAALTGLHVNDFIGDVYVLYTGIIDLVYQVGDSIIAMDHKTSSVAGPTFFASFTLSSQFRGYQWALVKSGIPINSFNLNAIFGRKITPTGTPFEYSRVPYIYPEWSIAKWRADTVVKVKAILEAILNRHFVENPTHCVHKYGICYYHDICQAHPTNQKAMIEQLPNYSWDPTTHSK